MDLLAKIKLDLPVQSLDGTTSKVTITVIGTNDAAEIGKGTGDVGAGKTIVALLAAMVAMENEGAVRALVGGQDYGESQFNRATDALRQPGSSFKPYVYATALMNGFKPTSVVVDSPVCIGTGFPTRSMLL